MGLNLSFALVPNPNAFTHYRFIQSIVFDFLEGSSYQVFRARVSTLEFYAEDSRRRVKSGGGGMLGKELNKLANDDLAILDE